MPKTKTGTSGENGATVDARWWHSSPRPSPSPRHRSRTPPSRPTRPLLSGPARRAGPLRYTFRPSTPTGGGLRALRNPEAVGLDDEGGAEE
jgi:hypothetical protein